MEPKKFQDVFSNVKLKDNIKGYFENVLVNRVIVNKARTNYKVYITSKRIIKREILDEVEGEIEKVYFGKDEIRVVIIEKYDLSDVYNTENIFYDYKDSIRYIFSRGGSMDTAFFDSLDFEVKDNLIIIRCDGGIIFESRYEVLEGVIIDIFSKKFDKNIKIDWIVNNADNEDVSHVKNESDLLLENALKSVSFEYKKVMEEITKNGGEKEGDKENKDTVKDNKDEKKSANNTMGEKSISSDKADNKKIDGKKTDSSNDNKKNNNETRYKHKLPKDPSVIFGRNFEEENELELKEIVSEIGDVIVKGQVASFDEREIRGDKSIVTLTITDFTDSICVKLFVRNEMLEDIRTNLGKGKFLKIKGVATYDTYDKMVEISSVVGIKTIADFRTKRRDNALKKRVELHCHTKMSEMDGVSKAEDIVETAHSWGHRAIAITDHGVVQGFPLARHAYDDLLSAHKKAHSEDGEPFDFKVIYGVEAYLVDDEKQLVTGNKNQSFDEEFVVFDIETTGFSAVNDRIIEIGAVKVCGGEIKDRFSCFVNPQIPIPLRIEQLTTINDEMVKDADTIDKVLPKFLEFVGNAVLVAHNADFDTSFIIEKAKNLGIETDLTYIDTVTMARFLIPELNRFKLDSVAKNLKVPLGFHHRAVDDAECTALIFIKLAERLKDRGILDLTSANEKSKSNIDIIKKAPTYHAIILVKNNIGRVNLYKLVSFSHIDYFNKRPRIPKSVYKQYSEGLIIGSACEAGELYQAIIHGRSDAEIARLCNFYDYYEIQPLGNNEFMVKTGNEEIDSKKKFLVDSEEELKDFNRKIVALGEKFNKPVVATCDVHFLNPEDEVYRRIIQAGKGFADADNQAPLFLRTTEEMMDEFDYLGYDKALEVVVTNTNLIADMIEDISPIHPDKCPPEIENSDVTLREICYKKAHDMYGDPLPDIVAKRLDKELNSIIGNGYAVMYIMAQKLVWKSNEDGYLVGSRGSVGSSFVATMSGITEVNPLRPHYYCKKCKYSDFDSEEVMAEVGGSGYDLPDKVCPVCGEKLTKDGHDIPFETFLGFYGDKEPDIDLNFSGDYQANAHAYTEVMFGKGHSFRAGTITGVAEKTAYGYVKKYFEERNIDKRRCEIERLAKGCEGIRRSSGQHPGGMVIVPADKEIYDFTPVQRPANDMTTDTITTHFEYHAIDRNLLKLDILGHDDPTIIRMLEDLTNTNAQEIPLDDPGVMSLFASTEALGIKPEDIDGVPLGCLGVPEFGTDFVIGMVQEAKPTKFADLVRISGLSHGTDVWLNNAQRFIAEGKATISTAICTRDDIMTYLINKGVEAGLSFTIMERVRKGQVAKGKVKEWGDMKETMKSCGVPDWYIESCELIKYMFPKAHAAAYVMMAYRIAYYKIYYPLAYYAAYFSIRAKAFDYELMCLGKEKLKYNYENLKRASEMGTASQKDDLTIKDMKLVMEMYARGFEFLPIDIYKSDAKRFQIVDNKLLPPFNIIRDVGDNAAESLMEAAKDGKFLSKEDLLTRAKISKTNVEYMSSLGLLEGLSEKNQISIFDLMG